MMEFMTGDIVKKLLRSGGSDSEKQSDILVHGNFLSPQIMAEIFKRINLKQTVAFSCSLVCRRWYQILSASGFWIEYMRYHGLIMPPPSLRSESYLNMKKVCFKQPFERNLITNPSGEKNFDGWTILQNSGNSFVVEKPPLNCADNMGSCIDIAFATSYGWCRKQYVIDLWEMGIEREFLDHCHPSITVSEYYNCRRDCACIYILNVKLLFDGQDPCVSNELQSGNRHRRLDHPFMFRREDVGDDVTSEVSVTRVREMDQWTNAEWQCVEHTFSDYPDGIRYVVFTDAGKDTQFWAGHYGSKIAKASVVVHFTNLNSSYNETLG